MNATQCRMARTGLNLSAVDLAKLAGLGYATVARFETGATIANESRDKIAAALDQAGALFSKSKGRVGVTVPD